MCLVKSVQMPYLFLIIQISMSTVLIQANLKVVKAKSKVVQQINPVAKKSLVQTSNRHVNLPRIILEESKKEIALLIQKIICLAHLAVCMILTALEI